MRYVILDLEGYFPKLVGVLIGQHIIQFYVDNQKYQYYLYEVLYIILFLVKDFFIVTFSGWEGRFISMAKQMLEKTHRSEELAFIDQLRVINIQERYFESITAGLMSIDDEILPDPLLHNSKGMNTLFELGYFHIIQEHNITCLKSTLMLFQKRFLPLHLLELEPHRIEDISSSYELTIQFADSKKLVFKYVG